jgi:NADH dehydrogenase
MANIGRSRAVVKTNRLQLSGTWAWLTWVAVHVVYLVGFRNRVLVMLDWAWCYIGRRRGARIVCGEVDTRDGPRKS